MRLRLPWLLSAWASGLLAVAAEVAPPTPRPLALFVTPAGDAKAAEFADVLSSTLAAQGSLQLVERAKLDAVLKELSLGLAGAVDPKDAPAIGKLAGAELLLCVDVKPDALALRLVEAASAKVLLEKQLSPLKDHFLSAAACRENVLAVVRGGAATRDLSVGIAAFQNKSGTDRSDAWGKELEQKLRALLRQHPGCIVLERQYPTELLNEADLARANLTGGKSPDVLPPASLVILGTFKDVDAQFVGGKPWAIAFEGEVRYCGRVEPVSMQAESNNHDRVMDAILAKVKAMLDSRSTGKKEPELDYWRKRATELTRSRSSRSDRDSFLLYETVRAWENVLLLGPADAAAECGLGRSLLLLHDDTVRRTKARETHLAQRGSRLIESAFRKSPGEFAADFCWMAGYLQYDIPERVTECVELITAHPEWFDDRQRKEAEFILTRLRPHAVYEAIEKAAQQTQPDSAALGNLFWLLLYHDKKSVPEKIAYLERQAQSKQPLVAFLSEYVMALLPSHGTNLEHFDRAIALYEPAAAAAGQNFAQLRPDQVFEEKANFCKAGGNTAEATQTIKMGTQIFLRRKLFNYSVANLYYQYLREKLWADDPETGWSVCEALLAAHSAHKQVVGLETVVQVHELLLARKTDTSVPGFDKLHLIGGTESRWPYEPAAAISPDGVLWLVLAFRGDGGAVPVGGQALRYEPRKPKAEPLAQLPKKVRTVAVLGDRVFCGGAEGLFELAADGHVLKQFRKVTQELPEDEIVSLSAAGNKLLMIFRNGERAGVAEFDPHSGRTTVLAPTSASAGLSNEPVRVTYTARVWWDAPRVYVNGYTYASHRARMPVFRLQDNVWTQISATGAPQYILHQDSERLQLIVEDQAAVFRLSDAAGQSQDVRCTFPSAAMSGEAAWDKKRLWVPAAAGIYEVDRATGKATPLTRGDKEQCRTILRHKNRLYVATTQGVYWCEIVPEE